MEREKIKIQIKWEDDDYKNQSDFIGDDKYQECLSFYATQFASKELSICLIENNHKQGLHLGKFMGLEIQRCWVNLKSS